MSMENIIPEEDTRQPLLLEHLLLLAGDNRDLLPETHLRRLRLCCKRLRFLVDSTLTKASLDEHDGLDKDLRKAGY